MPAHPAPGHSLTLAFAALLGVGRQAPAGGGLCRALGVAGTVQSLARGQLCVERGEYCSGRNPRLERNTGAEVLCPNCCVTLASALPSLSLRRDLPLPPDQLCASPT